MSNNGTNPQNSYLDRLTADNCAMLLIDHQTSTMLGVQDIRLDQFRSNVLALAQTAKVHNLPTVITASFAQGPNGPLMPEILKLFPDVEVVYRPGPISAWDDPNFVKAVEKTGRKKLSRSALNHLPLQGKTMKPNPLLQSNSDAPAYWQVDILWMILATGETTNGQYSLLEELCLKDSGPPPHTHTQLETFYILEGEITFLIGGKTMKGEAGFYVAVPPGTVHSFRVDSDTARILNSYVPAGFERTITELGEPAPVRTLPPKGCPMKADMGKVRQLMAEVGMKPVNEPDALRSVGDPRMDLHASSS